jgi:hypothetical protein
MSESSSWRSPENHRIRSSAKFSKSDAILCPCLKGPIGEYRELVVQKEKNEISLGVSISH